MSRQGLSHFYHFSQMWLPLSLGTGSAFTKVGNVRLMPTSTLHSYAPRTSRPESPDDGGIQIPQFRVKRDPFSTFKVMLLLEGAGQRSRFSPEC